MKQELSKYLLSIKAVELQPDNPFTWASGIKSPIYCDNRKILSFPEVRNFVRDKFVELIRQKYPQTEVIAGVATGAIAHGILVAQELNLPFVYIRAKSKGHGKKNLIEGNLSENAKVLVIEDLISTGGSSLAAVDALRNAKAEVLGLVAIFSYGFDIAKQKFNESNCKCETLTDYQTLIKTAVNENYIKNNHLEMLTNWRKQFIN